MSLGERPSPAVRYEAPDQSPFEPGDHNWKLMMARHVYMMDTPGSKFRRCGTSYFSDWYMTLYLGRKIVYMYLVLRRFIKV